MSSLFIASFSSSGLFFGSSPGPGKVVYFSGLENLSWSPHCCHFDSPLTTTTTTTTTTVTFPPIYHFALFQSIPSSSSSFASLEITSLFTCCLSLGIFFHHGRIRACHYFWHHLRNHQQVRPISLCPLPLGAPSVVRLAGIR